MADNKSCEGKVIGAGKDEFTEDYYVEYEDGTRKYAIGADSITADYAIGSPAEKFTMKLNVDCSHAIKGLKSIQREAKKATAALKELEEHKKDKYLVIEIDKLGDVPKVLHEGEEITLMEFINFQWTTRTDKPGNTDVIVDYFERACYGALERRSIREGVSS